MTSLPYLHGLNQRYHMPWINYKRTSWSSNFIKEGSDWQKEKNTRCWVQKFQNNFVIKIQASNKGPVGKELTRFRLCWGTDKLTCVIKNSKRLLSRIQDLYQILVLNGQFLCWLITKVCLYIIQIVMKGNEQSIIFLRNSVITPT